MRIPSSASLLFALYIACCTSISIADNTPAQPPDSDENSRASSSGAIFTAEMRWTIKREVMSKPGVMLDMANMTDNGYTWTKDVVWVGSDAGAEHTSTDNGASPVEVSAVEASAVRDKWYIAGFMFQRPRYKGVWLQYAFTLSKTTGEIANFRRWYGNATFR